MRYEKKTPCNLLNFLIILSINIELPVKMLIFNFNRDMQDTLFLGKISSRNTAERNFRELFLPGPGLKKD